MHNVMSLRERLLSANSCSFDAMITADYADKIYTFNMRCLFDNEGNLNFTVTNPETIAGITGSIAADGGRLTFDDKILAFSMLADGELSPVSAPWLLMKTLRGGYLQSGTSDNGLTHVTIDDSYEADALKMDLWMNNTQQPVAAEIVWQGRRILSVTVDNFQYL